MDPYEALGVSKSATAADIKKAYRKIVKESHPDLNPDDKAGEERFKAAAAAYDLLKDPEKRAQFDAGKIDSQGQERPEQQYYRQYAGSQGNPYRGGQTFDDYDDLSDFFSDYLRENRGTRKASHDDMYGMNANGPDIRYRLEVPFMDAALGGSTRITLPDGTALEVQVPRGIADGQTIRLRGKGGAPVGRGTPGDALISVSVAAHRLFVREGNDIHLALPITLDEAILGGKVEVPTVSGKVNLTIPKGASSGQVLRLRERGIAPRGREARGDQLVELKIVSPPSIDDDLTTFMETWRESHGYDPRKGMTA